MARCAPARCRDRRAWGPERRRSPGPSPNSAGIIIDCIRAAKIAKDRGIGGALISASSYLMKSPPVQRPDDVGRAKLEAYIAGDEER